MQLVVTSTATPSPEGQSSAQLDEFLREARERFRLAAEAEAQIRKEALDDLKFFSGEQWAPQIVADRNAAGRPCLTINLLQESVGLVINQQRQGRPSIQINPKGNDATVELAEIFQGLTRHIEVASNAEIAYDWGFQGAVIGGFGYIQVVTEYLEPRSFDQEVRIKRIVDPFTVYFDPSAQEPDYSDAQWAFVIEDVLRDDYKRRFPNSEVAGLADFRSIGDGERDWFREGSIRISQYWHVETEKRTLVSLADGSSVYDDEIPENAQIMQRDGEPVTREEEIRKVYCATINAREVLTGSKVRPFGQPWAGQWIPIIPVLGEELIVDGKRKLSGIVRHAKDPQRQYNYMRSALVEAVALAPKAPWVAEEGQIEGHEEEFKTANLRNLAVLTYKKVDVSGTPAPPPHRETAEPPIAAISVAVAQANQDFKSTTRIHEPILGQSSGEQSGRAIGLRQNQGNLASFGYVDNLARAIHHVGRILVDLVPKIYDRVGRVVRIVKPDQTHKLITLNQPHEEKPGSGETKFYDLSVGNYDVTVSVGPGYESKRQEFVASVLQLVQSAPQIAQFIMDLVVRHMDWPGAAEIADRLKKMLPEQLQDKEQQPGQPGQQQIPPQFQAKLEGLLQQHAQLTEALNKATSSIESRRMELESRERIAAIQAQTQLVVAELKSQSAEGIEMLRQQVAEINNRLTLLHADRPIEADMPGAQGQQPQQAGQPQPAAPEDQPLAA